MLCTRPNEAPQAPKTRPFCSMITVHEQIGLVPSKGADDQPLVPHRRRKEGNQFLKHHKDWLSNLAKRQREKEEQAQQALEKRNENFQKIKDLSAADRERTRKMKEEFRSTTNAVMDILDEERKPQQVALTSENLARLNQEPPQVSKEEEEAYIKELMEEARRKGRDSKPKPRKEKPAWALTEQEHERREDREVEELVDFFEKQDFKEFIEDVEVGAILKCLKEKISDIKQEKDWRERQAAEDEQRQRKEELRTHQPKTAAGASVGASVASERSSRAIQELKSKAARKEKGEEEWETSVGS
jgi:hypothetical protein